MGRIIGTDIFLFLIVVACAATLITIERRKSKGGDKKNDSTD